MTQDAPCIGMRDDDCGIETFVTVNDANAICERKPMTAIAIINAINGLLGIIESWLPIIKTMTPEQQQAIRSRFDQFRLNLNSAFEGDEWVPSTKPKPPTP